MLTADQKILNAFASSMIGGIAVAFVMSPFDLISTRLYNQGKPFFMEIIKIKRLFLNRTHFIKLL